MDSILLEFPLQALANREVRDGLTDVMANAVQYLRQQGLRREAETVREALQVLEDMRHN